MSITIEITSDVIQAHGVRYVDAVFTDHLGGQNMQTLILGGKVDASVEALKLLPSVENSRADVEVQGIINHIFAGENIDLTKLQFATKEQVDIAITEYKERLIQEITDSTNDKDALVTVEAEGK